MREVEVDQRAGHVPSLRENGLASLPGMGCPMRLRVTFCLLFLLSQAAHGQSSWIGLDQRPLPDTESRKSLNDFGGWLVVTSDLDWEKKWETSPQTVPVFNESHTVTIGKRLAILTFFVNPTTDNSGTFKLSCNLLVKRPNHTIAIDKKNYPCGGGILRGDPGYIRLSPMILNFIGETSDPPGTWTVELHLRDVVRHTTLNLKTTFQLIRTDT